MGSTCTGSAGLEAGATDSASATMFSRSNSDPLISVLSLSPLNKAKGLTVIGAPWAFAAPTGPPLVLREPQFQNSGLGVQRPRGTAFAFILSGASAPNFRCNPCAGFVPQLRQGCCPNQRAKTLGACGALQERWAMKLFSGWVISAGLVLVAGAANAQMLAPYDAGRSPYAAVSDFEGPYAAMPRDEASPRTGPMLLPAREVYTVVRENGFSPLGIPQQRGLYFTIAVI